VTSERPKEVKFLRLIPLRIPATWSKLVHIYEEILVRFE
jgi:hypothetical protein